MARTTNRSEPPEPGMIPAVKVMADYGLGSASLYRDIANGLPYIMKDHKKWFRVQDIHDYYSGRIGNDVKEAAGNG